MRMMKQATGMVNAAWLAMLAGASEHLAAPDEVADWPGEEMIRRAERNLVAWDQWLGKNRHRLAADELLVHENSVRWAKGVIKLWRSALFNRRPD